MGGKIDAVDLVGCPTLDRRPVCQLGSIGGRWIEWRRNTLWSPGSPPERQALCSTVIRGSTAACWRQLQSGWHPARSLLRQPGQPQCTCLPHAQTHSERCRCCGSVRCAHARTPNDLVPCLQNSPQNQRPPLRADGKNVADDEHPDHQRPSRG